MSLVRIGTCRVATAAPAASAAEIAREMAECNVGSGVVVRDGKPVGIVTGRDLVLRVLDRGLDPQTTDAASIASSPLVTTSDDAEPLEAAVRMGERRSAACPWWDPRASSSASSRSTT
jgi:CBS domain-containing protein